MGLNGECVSIKHLRLHVAACKCAPPMISPDTKGRTKLVETDRLGGMFSKNSGSEVTSIGWVLSSRAGKVKKNTLILVV